ncbi:MAG: hypothetical protein Q8R29_00400 [bacterium]|nr:hypothetical protein [bacterium]
MKVTFQQALRVNAFCSQEYALKKPYSKYVVGTGVTMEGGQYCITIFLRTSLPKKLSIPEKKDGVKIRTEVTGAFKAL